MLKAWRWEGEAAWSYCISCRKAGRNECQGLANFFLYIKMVPAFPPQLTQSSLTTCPELYLQGGSRSCQVNHQMITPTLCVFLVSTISLVFLPTILLVSLLLSRLSLCLPLLSLSFLSLPVCFYVCLSVCLSLSLTTESKIDNSI